MKDKKEQGLLKILIYYSIVSFSLKGVWHFKPGQNKAFNQWREVENISSKFKGRKTPGILNQVQDMARGDSGKCLSVCYTSIKGHCKTGMTFRCHTGLDPVTFSHTNFSNRKRPRVRPGATAASVYRFVTFPIKELFIRAIIFRNLLSY